MLPCTFNVPGSICNGLLYATCSTANATWQAPSISGVTSRPEKDKVLKEEHSEPGDCISCDHYMFPVSECMMASSGCRLSANGYTWGTIFINHSSGYITYNQWMNLARKTNGDKLLLEHEAVDVEIRIKSCHFDNRLFSFDEFKQHCEEPRS